MTESLLVLLDEAIAGTIVRLQGGKLRFDYSDEYRHRLNPTPLSVAMPVQVRSHPDHVIGPWLWGLLPDNDAVVARWARQFHVSSSPFSLLGTPIGADCAGAVRFAPPEEIDGVLARPGGVIWLDEGNVAQRLRELRKDSTAWLGESFAGQFSLAGTQAKTALLFRDGRWGVPSGSTPTTDILKPAVAGFDDHDLNEHLCLDAARRGAGCRSYERRPLRRRVSRGRPPLRPHRTRRPDRSGSSRRPLPSTRDTTVSQVPE